MSLIITDFIYSVLLTIINLIFSYLIYNIGNKFYVKNDNFYNNVYKIFDIGHYYIPDISKNEYIFYILFIINTILPICFGYDVTAEYTLYSIALFLIRLFINSVTILPKINNNNNNNNNNINVLNIADNCYEKNFSIYLSTIILISLILYNKKIVTNINLLILINLLYIILILSLRTHYTKDLLLTIFITYSIYKYD